MTKELKEQIVAEIKKQLELDTVYSFRQAHKMLGCIIDTHYISDIALSLREQNYQGAWTYDQLESNQ